MVFSPLSRPKPRLQSLASGCSNGPLHKAAAPSTVAAGKRHHVPDIKKKQTVSKSGKKIEWDQLASRGRQPAFKAAAPSTDLASLARPASSTTVAASTSPDSKEGVSSFPKRMQMKGKERKRGSRIIC